LGGGVSVAGGGCCVGVGRGGCGVGIPAIDASIGDAVHDAYTAERELTDDDPVTGMTWDDDRGSDADVYYLRVEQTDDGMAWAGPVWAEPGD
jgi:hypothetical protein